MKFIGSTIIVCILLGLCGESVVYGEGNVISVKETVSSRPVNLCK